jgi:hypothetical protein
MGTLSCQTRPEIIFLPYESVARLRFHDWIEGGRILVAAGPRRAQSVSCAHSRFSRRLNISPEA